ncbi:MAG TPA: hypothetical protein VMW54_11820 [Terriglobia bacterium]|nr:hypothetical protein [Terriglobia bacterium]
MFSRSMTNNPFSGTVVQAGPLPEMPRAIPTESEPARQEAKPGDSGYVGLILSPIARLKPADEPLRKEQSELLGLLSALGERVEKLIVAVRAERRAQLEHELDEVTEAGSKQSKKVRRLDSECRMAQAAWMTLSSEAKALGGQAAGLRERYQEGSRWRSRAELKQEQARIAEAQSKAQKAAEKATEAHQEYRKQERMLPAETEKLEALTKRQIQLSGELSGQRYQDPFTGLQTRPSL